MALRIPIPAATLSAGLDSLVVFGVVGQARRGSDRRATGRPAGRPSLHRRSRVRPAWYAHQQHRRSPRGLQLRRSRARAQLPDRGGAARPRSTTTTPGVSGRRWASGSIASCRRFGRVERGLEQDDLHMRSMNTALVAGRLGLLPQQHDRRRGRPHAGRIWTGRGVISSITCAASDRCRRSAAARSHTACCP